MIETMDNMIKLQVLATIKRNGKVDDWFDTEDGLACKKYHIQLLRKIKLMKLEGIDFDIEAEFRKVALS